MYDKENSFTVNGRKILKPLFLNALRGTLNQEK